MDIPNQSENVKIDTNELLKDDESIKNNKIDEKINTNSIDLKDLINNFNSDDNDNDNDNDMSKIMDKFSNGEMGDMSDIGNVIKQFTNIMSSNSNNSSHNKKTNDCTEEDDSLCEEDEDFDFNLDKYFISENGKNLCDVLLDIKTELTDIKLSLNK